MECVYAYVHQCACAHTLTWHLFFWKDNQHKDKIAIISFGYRKLNKEKSLFYFIAAHSSLMSPVKVIYFSLLKMSTEVILVICFSLQVFIF